MIDARSSSIFRPGTCAAQSTSRLITLSRLPTGDPPRRVFKGAPCGCSTATAPTRIQGGTGTELAGVAFQTLPSLKGVQALKSARGGMNRLSRTASR